MRGEVTFSWVNGMTAISFKSFRAGPEKQSNYATPDWQRQREGATAERHRALPPPLMVPHETLGIDAANSP